MFITHAVEINSAKDDCPLDRPLTPSIPEFPSAPNGIHTRFSFGPLSLRCDSRNYMCAGASEPEEIMKRIWLAIGLLGLIGSLGPAAAADLSRPAYPTKAAPYNASAYNWTGFYAGVNGSYGWGSSNWSAPGSSFNANGGLVGGQLGYNW